MTQVHQGHNIRRARMEKGLTQEALADKVCILQPSISKYEQAKDIPEEILTRFAKALDVPVEYLKTAEEDVPMVVFENVTNYENAGSNANIGATVNVEDINNNDNKVVNPIDKITELYERLLKEKDERYAILEKHIATLEKLRKQ